MVKNTFCFVIAIIGLALAGCANNMGVHDLSVPQEKLCTLNISDELYVWKFDGNDVKWYGSFHQVTGSVIQIPAGHHSFVVNYVSGSSRRIYSARDITYSQVFEAGKTYVMEPIVSGNRVSIGVKTE